MSSPPSTIDESEDNESAGVLTQDQAQQQPNDSVTISPRSNQRSSGGGSKRNSKKDASDCGSETQRSTARRSIHELEGVRHVNTPSTIPKSPDANNEDALTKIQSGGDARFSHMPSGDEPRRHLDGARGSETGVFRTKTLQDLEASYVSDQSDVSRSISESPSPRSNSELRRSSSNRRLSFESARDLPPELRHKSNGGTDNQRRTSLLELEAVALRPYTQSTRADKQQRTSLHALEAAALKPSDTVSSGADNQMRTSLIELESTVLGSSGTLSHQEVKKAFVSEERSSLGPYIAEREQLKQSSSINKDVDETTAKLLQSHENEDIRPRSKFLARAPSKGIGGQPLSTKQLEAETRNLDRLRRQEDGASRPGAYAVDAQSLSRSNSSTHPTSGIASAFPDRSGSLGPIISLRSLESSILRKHSAGQSAAVPLNASFRGDDVVDSISGHQYSGRSERLTVRKSEQGLTPGGPRPGAFEGQYSLQLSWITGTTPDEESSEHVSAGTSERHSNGDTSIPEGAEHLSEESNSESSGWRDDLDSEEEWAKSKRRRRNAVIVAALVIVAGLAAGIGIAVGGGSGDDSSTGPSTANADCSFDEGQVPSILEQCQFCNEVQAFSEGVLEQYDLLRGTLTGTMYSSYEEDTYSCSARNMAVAHVATEPGFDIKTRMQRFLLVFLYLSWEGKSWIDDTAWLSGDSECNWYGVLCRDGEVIGLEFSNNNVAGDLVRELYYLKSLERVVVADDFRSSTIRGSLLPEVGLLTNLKILAGEAFGITGTLPTEIGLMTSLEMFQLDAGSESLEGAIPSEFGRLTSLEKIKIHNHILRGPLPSEFGKLTKLTYFNTSRGTLGGEFPSEMNSLSLLTSLDVRGNLHIGKIPEISSFPEIVDFMIGNNIFSSDQSIDSLWNATNLEMIDLSNAKLQGSIPNSIGSFTNLKVFMLDDNRLHGTLPTTLGKLTSLVSLHLGRNLLFGSIPSQLGICSSLSSLELQRNYLSGEVPSELLHIPNLETMLLANNDLTGTLSVEYCSQLKILELTCESIPCPCDNTICECRRDVP